MSLFFFIGHRPYNEFIRLDAQKRETRGFTIIDVAVFGVKKCNIELKYK